MTEQIKFFLELSEQRQQKFFSFMRKILITNTILLLIALTVLIFFALAC